MNTVLYEGKAGIPADTASEMRLLLHRNAYQLPKNDCFAGLPDTLRMNPYASLANPLPGDELAFLLKNNPAQATDTIRTLFLDVNQLGLSQGEWDTYYSLKAYLANGPKQGPGTELLPGVRINLSRSRTSLAAEKIGHFTFDLRKYRIPMPAQGVYVSLKRIVVEGESFSGPERPDNYIPTGPMLGPACTQAKSSAWVYTHTTGWRPLTSAENPAPLYHEAIQVELVGYK
ncbi:hypothetical protein GCM10022409_31570 [Hymenobacter glaciei]|uniref:Uncharacterized protein n=1 Tax=Hymenobacter glaciei TaxID=877209 RepID=A0ABP7UH11_9BACT